MNTPGFQKGIDVRGQEKPYYPEGTPVSFDLGNNISGTGKIRGLGSQHVIDVWLVSLDEPLDKSVYPWSTISVPHTMLNKT